MKYIKEFLEATRNEVPDEFWNQQEPGDTTPMLIFEKLMKGYVICVDSKNVESFLDKLSRFSDEINVPTYSNDYEGETTYYFILVGDDIKHINKPTFGGYNLNVYKPLF
jgi:hypothetical protein